ncbi:MAG: sigma-54-dependent Fis family transcriptional regulator [Acidobacteria bacterium]|nr:sigma-54-dependent Fis family transcriptional regulator [Acidobacteriota bacterium]
MRGDRRLMVLDDNALFRRTIQDHFRGRLQVSEADTLSAGLALLESQPVDLAILDERLPDGSGLGICEPLLRANPGAKMVYVTGFPSFEHAVSALKAGVHDYLSKPVELAALDHAVERLLSVSTLERAGRLDAWRAGAEQDRSILIGASLPMRRLRETVALAAGSDAPVLITGETGTGKNLVAKAIHYGGPRARGPFVPLNCGALPEHLIEAELFGWLKGAFTGATASREGVLEMAEGGTLLLDEIGEMPFHLQSKLLSVLEDRQVMPLGGRMRKPVDVRILAATNLPMERAVEEKRFRADLYYRLNVLRIEIPPLREHLEDIPALVPHLLGLIGGREASGALKETDLESLQGYGWPGNVRELRNLLERALLLGVPPASLVLGAPERDRTEDPRTRMPTLAEVEEAHLRQALRVHGGNLTQAARALGLSLSTLKRRMKREPGRTHPD